MDARQQHEADIDYFMTQEESTSSAFARKVSDKPFGTLGMLGLAGSCAYAFYKYRKQGAKFSPSIFLIQLRVLGQGAVVGILAIGMIYEMMKPKKENKS